MVLARRHNELRYEEGNAKPGAEDAQGKCVLVSAMYRVLNVQCAMYRVLMCAMY